MRVYGVTELQLREILAVVNKSRYRGNLEFTYLEIKGKRKQYLSFTLRVRDSKGMGARLSHSGRRMVAACWHAHRDFMRELFHQFPSATLQSCQAKYQGEVHFLKTFDSTGDKNIGSMAQPLPYRMACDHFVS